MNHKGEAISITTIILVVVILAIILINVGGRECSKNKDCAENNYCGSDYACHPYPSEVVVKENNFLWSAVILGVSLILAAYIFRGGKIPHLPKKETH